MDETGPTQKIRLAAPVHRFWPISRWMGSVKSPRFKSVFQKTAIMRNAATMPKQRIVRGGSPKSCALIQKSEFQRTGITIRFSFCVSSSIRDGGQKTRFVTRALASYDSPINLAYSMASHRKSASKVLFAQRDSGATRPLASRAGGHSILCQSSKSA